MTVIEAPAAGVASRFGAVAALLLNAAVWGLSWWPFRHFQAQGVHPLWTTVVMYALASVFVLVARPQALLAVFSTPALWVILLASGFTNAAFNWAVSIGEVVRVVLLFYLAPLWAVGLARWLLGERLSAAVSLRVALALAGAVLVVGAGSPGGLGGLGASTLRLPDLLAILGGMMFALINVMLRREAARDSGERALAMFLGGALVPSAVCAGLLALGGAGTEVFAVPAMQWVWLGPVLALGLLFFVGNLALQYGASRLPAQVTAVVMPMEVVFASASAVAWGGETLSTPLLLGGALILSASLLAAWPSTAPAPPH